MLLYSCRHVSIGGYGIFVWNGDGCANREGGARLVGLLSKVAVRSGYRDGILLTVVSSDTLFEIVALNENLGVHTGVDAVGGCG